ncbi:phosphatidylinositol-specific phospholipase C/glycerophosphodiester phosphodiesterase family protein [Thalassobacillus devorans]|uniref:phosphatidylinositol-specific phospholipase C/glycerophosphodiester phosphodiesterase family protein n=1 Tax=Thalassobacillus devorans TaxID=279813 RepID=UPI001C382619|nr:phosphatidylinositol-specific phospholipase C/glycerophosphodiester phosphodiesterase family protein [Thalassobacillus devorans]
MKKWIILFMLAVVLIPFAENSASAKEGGEKISDEEVLPLAKAHAHNDYEHTRPLFDALQHGFTSVEADVWLVDGELRVAHDKEDVRAGRTLQSLYLEPLMGRVKQNDGAVYEGYDHEFILWIDIKSEGKSTYRAIDRQLREYKSMLTKYVPSGVKPGAVTVYISGNRPGALMKSQTVRYAAYDGRMSDLGAGASSAFIPVISDNWTKHFTWMGVGPMPQEEREKLRSIVATAHSNGQKVRFWATPDQSSPAREALWKELLKAGVDFINTDDLKGLEEFLKENDPKPSEPRISFEDTRNDREDKHQEKN